ncbi:hypothetical protein VTO73DRAFT_10157 [Trametes versicolor]
MAAEFPGAEDTARLWTVLGDGINTLRKIPLDRFDTSVHTDVSGARGRSMKTIMGNFIVNADAFDNAFFQVSPREARSMDPQQRVLLRVAHNALENAGYVPKATPTFDPESFGTFIGVATNDYVQNLRDDVDVYYSTGTLPAFLSGRISYAFGLGGPSMVLDTACSSSLVAIHQACRALASGDCNAALAGGVNIITSPDMYLGLARGHFLSETGQCRPWDASADGYCRSEGCGVFVLKRLEDAVAENDRILAVIRGSEVNQSGNARSITHPHVPAQATLFQKLVTSADVDPLDISVAECHGTGTQAGDPAELEAIRNVFAIGRLKDNPLHITSIKANIGHAEAASGAASLAKLILMLQHRTIPRHISFKTLNPRIPDLAVDNVRIDTESTPWTSAEGKTRLALLTNFGAAGSNSALLLEEHIPPPRIGAPAGDFLLGLSCKSEAAAEERRRTYMSHLEHSIRDTASLQDFMYSATARRELHGYRLAVSGRSQAELFANLGSAKVIKASPADKVVFVFSGQGSQYDRMGSDLYQHLPAFARIVDECHKKLVMAGCPGILDTFISGLHHSERRNEPIRFRSSQASLFVLEYALAQLWISWGIRPCAVMGHSFGEFAALTVAGVLTLDDALRVVTKRAEVIAAKCTLYNTGMTSVQGPVGEFAQRLGRAPFSHLEVCCYNSATSFVVGGDLGELRRFEEMCTAQGVRHTRLDIPYAYHSAAMDPVHRDLEALYAEVMPSPPEIPVLSNATGSMIQPGDSRAIRVDYFAQHCRKASRFQQGVDSFGTHINLSEVAAFIEVGPHAATLPLLRGIQKDGSPLLLPSARKTSPGLETLCTSLAQLYCTSVPVDWRKVFADLAHSARLVDLPAYPFAQTRFWVPYKEHVRRDEVPLQIATTRSRFSLLDRYVRSASSDTGAVFETSLETLSELIQGHKVGDVPLCPASVYVELATSAAISVLQDRHAWAEGDVLDFSEVVYPRPLVYTPRSNDRIHVEVSLLEKHKGSFSVSLIPKAEAAAQVYCRGSFKKTTSEARLSKFSYAASTVQREIQAVLRAGPAGASETFTTRTVYDLLFSSIVAYSNIYRAVQTITVNTPSSTANAVIQLPKPALPGTFAVHPIFVDALIHVAGFLVNFTRGMNGRDAYICSRADKIQFVSQAFDPSACYGIYAAITREEKGTVTVDAYALEVDDPRGRIVARLKRVHFHRLGLEGFKKVLQSAAGRSPMLPSREQPIVSPMTCLTSEPQTPPSHSKPQDLERAVLRVIAETAGIPAEDVRSDAHLAHLGVDSLMLWEVAAGLRAIVPGEAQELSAQELAGATTVGDLVRLVSEKYGHGSVLPRPSTDDTITAPTLLPAREVSGAVIADSTAVDMDAVKTVLSSVLDVPAADISNDAELHALGLDSLSAIEARHTFDIRFGVKVDEETLFACHTVRDILRALVPEVPPSPTSSRAPDIARPSAYTPSLVPETPPSPPAPPAPSSAPSSGPPASPLAQETVHHADGYSLVRIQSRPPGTTAYLPPLILIHDGSGTIGAYERLAPLGRDVWAVRNADFGRFFAAPGRAATECGAVVALALAYAATLATEVLFDENLCVRGGCIVGGWSFGGVVAYEVAHQLRAMGVRVGLVLIDAPAPQPPNALPDWLIDALHARLTTSKTASSDHGFAVQMRIAARALAAYRPSPAAPALRAVYLRAMEPADLAVSTAESGELDAQVRAFLTKEGDQWTVPLWEQALGGGTMDVLDVPGDHFRILGRANMEGLSEQLERGLHLLSEWT